jgi:hypothetical protein
VTKEMVQLKLVTDQAMHKVTLHLNKAVQQLQVSKGRHHLALQEMHQLPWVLLQQKHVSPQNAHLSPTILIS